MQLIKRGDFYHYVFEYCGIRYRGSTRVRSQRVAENIAAARRLQIVKHQVGLAPNPRIAVPTLREFQRTFVTWVEAEHRERPKTCDFYKVNYSRLLDFPELADAKLDKIDAALVSRYKDWRLTHKGATGKVVGKTTCNRYLTTLRKTLFYACETVQLISAVPPIRLYPKSATCEREREFVFSDKEFQKWLAACPEPLRSASILARNCGICRGELIALQKDCVALLENADVDNLWGEVVIRRGLKRDARKRSLAINRDMRDALLPLLHASKCKHVFTALTDARLPLSVETLGGQLRDMKRKVQFDADAGLHALRHTFLTEMGKTVDVFTLKQIAGHASIATTQRYVHPQKDAIREAFARNAAKGAGSPQKPPQTFSEPRVSLASV